MRCYLAHDPKKQLEKIKCPVLVLNGFKDFETPVEENIGEIMKAL